MKIIDLLNKIANEEDVPAKIKFRNNIFRYTGCSYYCDAMCTTFFNIYNFAVLNEKVEIIEENKKIKKLKMKYGITLADCVDKINGIIDKINKEDKRER